MKNKILILILSMFLIFTLVGCNFLTPDIDEEEPVEVLSAEVLVLDWNQVCNDLKIEYLITNTGTVDIDFSEILFEITYEDESVRTLWLEGASVDVDCWKREWTEEIWEVKNVVDIVAIDWKLASY